MACFKLCNVYCVLRLSALSTLRECAKVAGEVPSQNLIHLMEMTLAICHQSLPTTKIQFIAENTVCCIDIFCLPFDLYTCVHIVYRVLADPCHSTAQQIWQPLCRKVKLTPHFENGQYNTLQYKSIKVVFFSSLSSK